MKCIALVICFASTVPILLGDSLPVGTWVRRADKGSVSSSTIVIEAAGRGAVKLTMKVTIPGQAPITMSCTTQGDGKDEIVYLDGKPSGETMAIRRVDDRHSTNVVKNGTAVVNQKSEVSLDGKTITTESTPVSPPGPKTVEYWDKK